MKKNAHFESVRELPMHTMVEANLTISFYLKHRFSHIFEEGEDAR